MKLTVVGCTPAWTRRPGRASSCYLVEQGDTAIVLDMGQGTFSELWRYREPASLRAVFVSHLHGDHCVDLIPLRHWVRFENGGRAPRLYAPPELRERFGCFQADPEFLSDFEGEALAPGTLRIGDLSVEVGRVTHTANSFGFRVAPADRDGDGDGPGLVYSGDCAVADDLLPLIRSGDTLLSEASFGADPADAPIHLTAVQAAGAATRGGASSLILTHIVDGHDEDAAQRAAQTEFDGPIDVARPGLTIDIG